jgi:GntR family transcriptional regulator/MocR family aminotransferase
MLHLTTALDASSSVPLYEQLYRSLAADMRAGTLPAGTRMPGKRSLAAELSVSVNTVDAAYQRLAAEGYLVSRARSGFYVEEYLTLPASSTGAPSAPSATPLAGASLPPLAETPAPAPLGPPIRYDLSTGGIDTGLFPFRTWGRLQKELLYSSPELLAHGDAQGDETLRTALAAYLEEYRGVRCAPHQIVVGAGLEYLLGLLAPLLPGPVGVEDPGYPRAARVLRNNGVTCRYLPVDEGGLSVQALAASDAAVCYITPSHQFPTGVTMPAPRRAELLHWAAQQPRRRYIIEDDYDSEFRFDTRPLPSLQGMAGADGPVIYLSTCSRSLAPGIRIAYMVLPEHLLPRWRQAYALYSGTVGRFEQQTLARFINEGYFARLLARERVAYKARRTRLAEALRAAFAPKNPESPIQPIQIELSGLHTGLHLLLTVRGLPPQVTDEVLARAARAEGVCAAPLSAYYAAQPDFDQPDFEKSNFPCTLVLGYGALADSLCEEAAEALKSACTAAAEAASSR